MELSNIPNTGFFNRIASLINENFDKIRQRFLEVGDASASANAAAVSAAQAAQSLATIQNEIASLDTSQSQEAEIAALNAKVAVNTAGIGGIEERIGGGTENYNPDTLVNQGYINLNGNVTSSTLSGYTNPIPISVGDIVTVTGIGTYVSCICYTESGATGQTSFEVLVNSQAGTTSDSFTWVATKGGYVVLCGRIDSFAGTLLRYDKVGDIGARVVVLEDSIVTKSSQEDMEEVQEDLGYKKISGAFSAGDTLFTSEDFWPNETVTINLVSGANRAVYLRDSGGSAIGTYYEFTNNSLTVTLPLNFSYATLAWNSATVVSIVLSEKRIKGIISNKENIEELQEQVGTANLIGTYAVGDTIFTEDSFFAGETIRIGTSVYNSRAVRFYDEHDVQIGDTIELTGLETDVAIPAGYSTCKAAWNALSVTSLTIVGGRMKNLVEAAEITHEHDKILNGFTYSESYVGLNSAAGDRERGYYIMKQVAPAGQKFTITLSGNLTNTYGLDDDTHVVCRLQTQSSNNTVFVLYCNSTPFNGYTGVFTPSQDTTIIVYGRWGSDEILTATLSVESKLDSLSKSSGTGIIALNQNIRYVLEKQHCKLYDEGSVSRNVVNFLHFTDVHGNTENLMRISEFIKEYSGLFDGFLSSGDQIAETYPSSPETTTEWDWWKEDGKNVMLCLGNHEIWRNYETKETSDIVTESECYAFYMQTISNWGVTGTSGKCYYYKDYQTANLRLIVLDQLHWNSTQATWFTNTLASAKTNGYAVLVMGHYCCGIPANFHYNDNTGFTSLDISRMAGGTSNQDVYNGRIEQETIMTAWINGGGKLALWLCGHTHTDFFGTSGNGVPTFISEHATYTRAGWDCRIQGTKSQDSFNIVTIDTTNQKVYLFRVGNDVDKMMREKKFLCWDYINKTLL